MSPSTTASGYKQKHLGCGKRHGPVNKQADVDDKKHPRSDRDMQHD